MLNPVNQLRRLCGVGVLAVLVAATVTAILPQAATAATYVPDGTHISTNTEWTAANSPYILEGSAYVDSGATLTVDAGVTVQLAGGHYAQLTINGTLDASGTSGNHVVFTSGQTTPAAGDWYDINVNGTASLVYTDIFYGGWGFADYTQGEVVVPEGGTVTLDHSVFENSKTSGLLVGTGGTSNFASATVTHSTFGSNDDGIYVDNGYLSLTKDNQVNDNAVDGVVFNYTNSYTGTASDVSNNTISGNGRYGVKYVPTLAFVDSSSEPTGHGNDIYGNSSYQYWGTQYEPSLNWTHNWWGTAWTYTNPSVCWVPYPDSPYHIQSTFGALADGPVYWVEDDITVQVSDDPPAWVTYKCGIDQVEDYPWQSGPVDNSGL